MGGTSQYPLQSNPCDTKCNDMYFYKTETEGDIHKNGEGNVTTEAEME